MVKDGNSGSKGKRAVLTLDLQQVEIHPNFTLVLVDKCHHLNELSGSALGTYSVVEFAKQKDTVEAQFQQTLLQARNPTIQNQYAALVNQKADLARGQ